MTSIFTKTPYKLFYIMATLKKIVDDPQKGRDP